MTLVIEYINGDGPAIGAYLEPRSPATAQVTDNTVTVAGSLEDRVSESFMRRLFNSLNVAKDSQDRMRVVVDNELGMIVNRIRFWSSGSYVTRYVEGGVNSTDARDQLMLQSRANFNFVRTNRWSVT